MADKPAARPSRFDTPAARLDLSAVAARQMRKVRLASLAVAIALHGSLAVWKVSVERKAIKPLTTRFIKREPRLVKPLELRKMPKPKRREMRRRMKQVRAKVDTRGMSRAPKAGQVLERMVRSVTAVGQAPSFERPALEPMIESGKVSAAKIAEKGLDLALEMVDVSAFDFGRDKAMVVQDPTDKRRVKGFFKIASVYLASNTLVRSRKTIHDVTSALGAFTRQPGAVLLSRLARAINEYTDIQVEVLEGIPASDQGLLRIPWALLIPQNWADLTAAEARNIGQWLTGGGFLMVEGDWRTESRCRNLFEKSLATQGLMRGQHWEFEQLPNDHPIYHSFFDFDGAPWGGDPFDYGFNDIPTGGNPTRIPLNRRDYIEGVELDGRVVAIYETKGYARHWVVRQLYSKTQDVRDILHFGINIVVFALTQEGSVARQAVAAGY